MSDAVGTDVPVKTKAILIEPESMAVLWMNESASQDLPEGVGELVPGAPVDGALPIAETLGIPGALRAVADTGVARHLRTDLVSTSRGRVAIVTSVYRLPDGKLLILTEHAWQVGREGKGGSGPRGRS